MHKCLVIVITALLSLKATSGVEWREDPVHLAFGTERETVTGGEFPEEIFTTSRGPDPHALVRVSVLDNRGAEPPPTLEKAEGAVREETCSHRARHDHAASIRMTLKGSVFVHAKADVPVGSTSSAKARAAYLATYRVDDGEDVVVYDKFDRDGIPGTGDDIIELSQASAGMGTRPLRQAIQEPPFFTIVVYRRSVQAQMRVNVVAEAKADRTAVGLTPAGADAQGRLDGSLKVNCDTRF